MDERGFDRHEFVAVDDPRLRELVRHEERARIRPALVGYAYADIVGMILQGQIDQFGNARRPVDPDRVP